MPDCRWYFWLTRCSYNSFFRVDNYPGQLLELRKCFACCKRCSSGIPKWKMPQCVEIESGGTVCTLTYCTTFWANPCVHSLGHSQDLCLKNVYNPLSSTALPLRPDLEMCFRVPSWGDQLHPIGVINIPVPWISFIYAQEWSKKTCWSNNAHSCHSGNDKPFSPSVPGNCNKNQIYIFNYATLDIRKCMC